MLVLRIYWVFWEMGVLGGKQRGEGKKDTTKTEKGKTTTSKDILEPESTTLSENKGSITEMCAKQVCNRAKQPIMVRQNCIESQNSVRR